MRSIGIRLCTGLAAMTLLLAACGGQTTGGEAGTTDEGTESSTAAPTVDAATSSEAAETEELTGATPEESHGEPIRIGVITGLTGAYVSLGEEQRNGAELAAELLGGQVGGRPLEVIVRDSALEPDTALREAQSLVQGEQVDFLTGCVSAATTLAINQVAQQAGIPYLGTCQTEQLIRPPNRGPDTYHLAPATSQPIDAGMQWVCENLGTNVFFLLPDYAWGHEQNTAYQAGIEEAGCTSAGLAWFPLGTSDFNAYIPQIEEASPDVLWFGGAGRDQVSFLGQAAQFGLADEMEIFINIEDLTFDEEIGFDTLDGTYGMAHFYWGVDDPGVQEFVAAYREANDRPPGGYSVFLYNAVRLIADAAEQDATDPDAFREMMEGLEFSYAQGPQEIRACDHQSLQATYILEGLGADEAEERGGDAEFGYREIIETVPASDDFGPTCEDTEQEFEPAAPDA